TRLTVRPGGGEVKIHLRELLRELDRGRNDLDPRGALDAPQGHDTGDTGGASGHGWTETVEHRSGASAAELLPQGLLAVTPVRGSERVAGAALVHDQRLGPQPARGELVPQLHQRPDVQVVVVLR